VTISRFGTLRADLLGRETVHASGGLGSELVSYRTLRRVVGLLGVSLPIVLALWGFALLGRVQLLASISDYYSLRTRDAFVGVLFTIGWFLFTYRGYDWRDNTAGNLACVFALGVALFPNGGSRGEHTVHVVSATALFLVLAYFSFFLFTLSDAWPTAQKLIRNRIYRACGATIAVCIVAIARESLFVDVASPNRYSPGFWLESVALWAFGWSWFVKGETVFRDR
jgi:hypothetical protein